MDEATSPRPRKGGLSVLRHQRADEHRQHHRRAAHQELAAHRLRRAAEKISGEYVNETHPGRQPHLPRLPGGLQEGSARSRQGTFKVHMESVEYESAWSLGAQLRQRRHRRRGLHHRPVQRLRPGHHRDGQRPVDVHGGQREGAASTATDSPGATRTSMVELVHKIALPPGHRRHPGRGHRRGPRDSLRRSRAWR